jgi:5-methyltetrahydrofolate--homocysteine methyltransferase
MENSGVATSRGKILMATVKGDVHDIGKNIVGVVLQCNGYEVIDLGVMVPTEKIIQEAVKHNVDAVGLSGLITPSLDEMVKVAAALNKQNCSMPLLIGGATTSKVHTAIKIAPKHENTVYIRNASVAVSEVSNVLTNENAFEGIIEKYEKIRSTRKESKIEYFSIENSRKNQYYLKSKAVRPKQTGMVQSAVSIGEIRDYIDWSPFAMTWGLRPKQLKEEAGISLLKDANEMIDSLAKNISVSYAFSIDQCRKKNEDVTVCREKKKTTFNFLRQPQKKTSTNNMCLSDFLHNDDWLGTFAIWVGGIDEMADTFRESQDDYRSIMVQALGDRFAEATAEWLHQQVRIKHWGYSKNEADMTNEDLVTELYDGIRPAPGYPACPDHTQKIKIIDWLGLKNVVKLTDGLTMIPKAAICGWYFASPESTYFGISKLPNDYLDDLQERNKDFEKYRHHLE